MVKVSFSIEEIRFDDKGLVPAIIQDVSSGEVLMLGYMNRDALEKTIETGKTWFWSRSRGKLWNKGETSGNYHEVESITIDCDNDTLLVKVYPKGPTCHTGNYSCFYRGDDNSVFSSSVIDEVYQVILERKKTMPEGSYVAKKMKEGIDRILKKVSEEAGEFVIASKNGDEKEIIHELADLVFHSLLVLGYLDIPVVRLYEELGSRRK
ncbi:MAG: bifunctional phosphoribosyl-AMP cyclohydrolase/phosphoribosyl-ATP diphosphatase HisIE [Spirochaetia bacterium]|nr:bifunctional phosphoribosyl-AMP cyclohydrolase/phosphoribosyl-ATP diphosphatase HisIE [Spirochaetota bacterium]MCX8097321.1 bifunctional phosphoribosyl-AMP cyclohydrolase/phosphoribosyl-ATP diphosphatase HisIE [Spirochaetota bacterium]MDW8112830.1 bifunctional phosphoribosyl-AMP cyclohydrolase/phosphoribosyl-ATP diphosphatase HisIE [Spirochaetia bacterium]